MVRIAGFWYYLRAVTFFLLDYYSLREMEHLLFRREMLSFSLSTYLFLLLGYSLAFSFPIPTSELICNSNGFIFIFLCQILDSSLNQFPIWPFLSFDFVRRELELVVPSLSWVLKKMEVSKNDTAALAIQGLEADIECAQTKKKPMHRTKGQVLTISNSSYISCMSRVICASPRVFLW